MEVTGVFQKTPELASPGHPSPLDKAPYPIVGSLGELLEQTDDQDQLMEIIRLHKEALEVRLPGHPLRDYSLDGLAVALTRRFEKGDKLIDAEEATGFIRQALELRPWGHPLRIETLNHQRFVHRTCIAHLDNEEYLPRAIIYFRKMKESRHPKHRLYDIATFYLGSALHHRYDKIGDADDLLQAVTLYREALELRPPGDQLRDICLNALALALSEMFAKLGDVSHLVESASLYREALELRPLGHPSRSLTLNNIGLVYSRQYQVHGDEGYLAKAISAHREQISLCRPTEWHYGFSLAHLAGVILLAYGRYGRDEDLSEALRLSRESMNALSLQHVARDCALTTVALCLNAQYKRYGDEGALLESIPLFREALILRPVGHLRRAAGLYNLGDTLLLLCRLRGLDKNVDEAVQHLEEAIKLYPPDNPYRWRTHSALAAAFELLSKRDGQKSLLSKSIDLYRQAAEFCTLESPYHSDCLYDLAQALRKYQGPSTTKEHLIDVLHLHERVLNMRTTGHPEKSHSYHAVAELLLDPALCDEVTLQRALDHIEMANRDSFCSAHHRLQLISKTVYSLEAALGLQDNRSMSIAERALTVYVQAIELLPQAAHLGMDLPTRLRELVGTEHLCRIAAIRALLLERPSTAVEVLEEGRTVFWTQSLHLRTTDVLAALSTADQEKLGDLLRTLEHRSRLSISDGHRVESRDQMERQIEERRQLNANAQAMIHEIQSRPGFERFMKIGSFATLSAAAAHGIVVFLLVTDFACFALAIIDQFGTTITIKLDEVGPELLHQLRIHVHSSGFRDCGMHTTPDEDLEESTNRLSFLKSPPRMSAKGSHATLSKIWHMIVRPVIEKLGLQKARGRERPRLYWCPVGDFAFLPLHAAGVYTGADRVCVSDFAVSSYTPSLSTIIKTRKDFSPISRDSLKALLVAEPSAVGFEPLPQAEDEVWTIYFLMGGTAIERQVRIAPTVQTVVDSLSPAHILHLACHGVQRKDALESHFVLDDGPLTIAMLSKLDLPNAVLAFLSACETAKGDQNQPDQAIHLAASMLFCGFRSVIGTMWTMHDADGPIVAKTVYGELLKKPVFELDDIPYALDAAVQALRENGVPPNRWATFIHMGA